MVQCRNFLRGEKKSFFYIAGEQEEEIVQGFCAEREKEQNIEEWKWKRETCVGKC